MRRVVLGLSLVITTACSDGSDNATTTTRFVETTTTASFAGTTTTPTTTAAPCPDPPVGSVTVAMAQAAGDVDGDGTTDRLMTYGTGSDENPAPWHVRVELGSGGGYDGEIPDAPSFAPVRLLGAADVSEEGAAEVFVVVEPGASVALVGVFQWQGACMLARLTGPVGAEPSLFPVGGTVTHLDGLACGGGGLNVLSATSDDGSTYATRHRAVGGRERRVQARRPHRRVDTRRRRPPPGGLCGRGLPGRRVALGDC